MSGDLVRGRDVSSAAVDRLQQRPTDPRDLPHAPQVAGRRRRLVGVRCRREGRRARPLVDRDADADADRHRGLLPGARLSVDGRPVLAVRQLLEPRRRHAARLPRPRRGDRHHRHQPDAGRQVLVQLSALLRRQSVVPAHVQQAVLDTAVSRSRRPLQR